MAMEYAVQRLTMGDVVLIDVPEEGGEVEAKVVRAIDRTESTVRVSPAGPSSRDRARRRRTQSDPQGSEKMEHGGAFDAAVRFS